MKNRLQRGGACELLYVLNLWNSPRKMFPIARYCIQSCNPAERGILALGGPVVKLYSRLFPYCLERILVTLGAMIGSAMSQTLRASVRFVRVARR